MTTFETSFSTPPLVIEETPRASEKVFLDQAFLLGGLMQAVNAGQDKEEDLLEALHTAQSSHPTTSLVEIVRSIGLPIAAIPPKLNLERSRQFLKSLSPSSGAESRSPQEIERICDTYLALIKFRFYDFHIRSAEFAEVLAEELIRHLIGDADCEIDAYINSGKQNTALRRHNLIKDTRDNLEYSKLIKASKQVEKLVDYSTVN